MNKQTTLYIPTPCHEDWNKMTPTQQGKFCAGCKKQVVDFSLMSDQQVLNFLSDQNGKLCGRFDESQLQRPLVETKQVKKKSWWMALTLPLLFLFERSEGQTTPKITGDTIYNTLPTKEPQMLGKVRLEATSQTTITGKITDKKNDAVPFASVTIKGTKRGVAADASGEFSIKIPVEEQPVKLLVSAVGYESVEKEIPVTAEKNIKVQLQSLQGQLGGMVVVVVGGIQACHRVKKVDTVKATVKKIFKVSSFKMYPNPATAGSLIRIEMKDTGSYQLQLFDNQSRLIKAEEINIISDKTSSSFQLPSNIAAGIYYLRMINEATKKSYTEKLVIQ